MTWAYFDTSVLVKNYIEEAGSTRARRLLQSYSFFSSSISPLELMSALMRRRSRGELEVQDLPKILDRVREDRSYWKLLDVGPSVLSQGEVLVQKVQMRALDAIHVASLVTFQAASGIQIPFITADSRQRDAAEQMKLNVVWVG